MIQTIKEATNCLRGPNVVVELEGIKTWLPVLGRRLHIVLINSFITLEWFNEMTLKLAHTISITQSLYITRKLPTTKLTFSCMFCTKIKK